jgi:hypothetical protein
MKYIVPTILTLLSACSIRAVALIETEDASYGGETTIQRKQDKIVERQHTLFENVINGTPQVTPTPELP